MRVIMAQFTIKEEALQDFAAARETIFSELARRQPRGIRYTWTAIPDGRSFVGWLELDDGVENPLPDLEAGRLFMSKIPTWVAKVPVREELQVVASWQSAT